MERHPYDPISFVAGALLVVAGGLLVAGRLDVLTQANWLLPALLIGVALTMFGSAAWSLRRTDGGERPSASPAE